MKNNNSKTTNDVIIMTDSNTNNKNNNKINSDNVLIMTDDNINNSNNSNNKRNEIIKMAKEGGLYEGIIGCIIN